jgi:hypothetical protein
MFALLGSLVGFISSLAPDIFGIIRDKKDKAHELQILDRQMELTKLGHTTRMEEIQTVSEMREAEYIYKYADRSGVMWIDGFAGSVRPFLTYAFFALYAWVKLSAFLVMRDQLAVSDVGVPIDEVLFSIVKLWSEQDETIFAAIISFWFGSRAFRKK